MIRPSVSYAAAALAVAGALWFAACKSSTSNNCGSGTPPSLVGSYSLESYTLGTTTLTSPTASGTLQFRATMYNVNLSLPGPTAVVDSGTYTIVGSACINELSQAGNPTFSGTFQLNLSDSTFSVTGTAAGQVAASVWKKTS